ncbi:hypothetical protein D3C87_1809100 [compost metagenome]
MFFFLQVYLLVHLSHRHQSVRLEQLVFLHDVPLQLALVLLLLVLLLHQFQPQLQQQQLFLPGLL